MSTATATNPWKMKATSGGGGDYELCPTGNYPGTIVGLIDIGTHKDDYKGQVKTNRKLVVVFELTKKKSDGQPFVLASRYTWSFHSKSGFRELVQNVTGRSFAEGEEFNPTDLISLPVMVQINHSGTAEKSYHNIGSVAQFPEGLPAPTPVHNPPVLWSVLEGTPFPTEATDWLPFVYGESIKDLAEACLERKGNTPPDGGNAAAGSESDDIPF